jgi:hypothetical protein
MKAAVLQRFGAVAACVDLHRARHELIGEDIELRGGLRSGKIAADMFGKAGALLGFSEEEFRF